jgi:hypothetical protein
VQSAKAQKSAAMDANHDAKLSLDEVKQYDNAHPQKRCGVLSK